MIVNFPLDDDPGVSMIAWTTTPWTLPSNLALCVHPDFTYVKVVGEYELIGVEGYSVVLVRPFKRNYKNGIKITLIRGSKSVDTKEMN